MIKNVLIITFLFLTNLCWSQENLNSEDCPLNGTFDLGIINSSNNTIIGFSVGVYADYETNKNWKYSLGGKVNFIDFNENNNLDLGSGINAYITKSINLNNYLKFGLIGGGKLELNYNFKENKINYPTTGIAFGGELMYSLYLKSKKLTPELSRIGVRVLYNICDYQHLTFSVVIGIPVCNSFVGG